MTTTTKYLASYGAAALSITSMRDNKVFIDGMVPLQPGMLVDVGGPALVVHVNDCCARVQPVTVQQVEFKTRWGVKVCYEKARPVVSIARNADPESILPEGEVDHLLARNEVRSAVGNKLSDKLRKEEEESMRKAKEETKASKKAAKRAPRGGLAADKAAMEAEQQQAPAAAQGEPQARSRGKLGEMYGHSVTSVIRALAQAGASTPRVKAIMAARGQAVAPATVQIQCSWGRAGKGGDPAPLAKAELAELLALADEPAKSE